MVWRKVFAESGSVELEWCMSAVYWLWYESNGRLHGRKGNDEEWVFEKVRLDVCGRLQGCKGMWLKIRNSWELALQRGISLEIFQYMIRCIVELCRGFHL
ncbi:hypothetical protein LIER_26849 [Lithospermum erythrorhizon]|uniref:Uncharacterized protein n=1 Tax=Lithospermum erythrorhizon TaxID=34254 RepID=A0AAV3RDI9_LITER